MDSMEICLIKGRRYQFRGQTFEKGLVYEIDAETGQYLLDTERFEDAAERRRQVAAAVARRKRIEDRQRQREQETIDLRMGRGQVSARAVQARQAPVEEEPVELLDDDGCGFAGRPGEVQAPSEDVIAVGPRARERESRRAVPKARKAAGGTGLVAQPVGTIEDPDEEGVPV